MDWTWDKSRPISRQLCEKICVAVASGEYRTGDRLLSVREIALVAGVNPNTVQKSLEELERLGVVHSVPARGWFVNDSTDAARAEVESLLRQKSEDYLASMAALGCSSADAVSYLQKISNERNEDK